MYVAAFEQIESPATGVACHPSSELPSAEDEPSLQGSDGPASSKEKITEHYRTIGTALLVCEASSYRVGIPWMLPVGDVSARRYDVGTLPGDYIRETLVTVSTNCLQMYIEDLEAPSDSCQTDAELFIELQTWIEQYSFLGACSAASMFVGFACAKYLFHSTPASFIAGLVTMVLGYLVGQTYTTSEARRASFHRVLNNEIMRRRGIDPNGPAGTRVYSGQATSLSD